MRGKYGLMVDADAATDIEDLDRLLIRMRDVESTGTGLPGVPLLGRGEGAEREGERGDSTKKEEKHGMVVGSRAHMEGEAVAKVRGVHVHGNRPRVCAWIGGTGPCFLCRQHWLFELVFL